MAYPRSPGPAHYKIPPSIGYKDHNKTKWIMPAYSIGKNYTGVSDDVIPGPKYMIRDQTRFGYQRAPAYTIKKRAPSKFGSPNPGPGTYFPEKYGGKTALYSFGKRPPSLPFPLSPGPASYNVRKDKPEGPAFNILGRQPMKIEDKSPGPAAYNPKMDAVIKKPRAIKISGRPDSGYGKGFGPGPGHYKFDKVGRSIPKYTFGNKHKDWQEPYIVPEDNACIYTPRSK